MNINLYIQIGTGTYFVSGLAQAPSEVTEIVYDRGVRLPWKQSVRNYLKLISQGIADRATVKEQRKLVGKAWRTAEEFDGSLLFVVN